MVGEKILAWFSDTVRYLVGDSIGGRILAEATTREELEASYNAMDVIQRTSPGAKIAYQMQLAALDVKEGKLTGPAQKLILSMLDEWVENVQQYDLKDPAKAKETLAALSADIMTISGSALGLELALGAGPNNQGPVTKSTVSELMAWLGFGAVVTAVAHDPVKIGLLRPYQDQLEATFRNRRPDDFGLFQAYRTRELSPTKVADLDKLNDEAMDAVEAENESIYQREIAKWGYPQFYADALARSATTTLNFASLNALARQGLLTRGYAIYNLWGIGLDRAAMKGALDALMAQNRMSSYEGFRSMVEPSFVEGDISEQDLREYWTRIMVPADVQEWVMPRLRKRREAALARAKGQQAQKERDLTVSQVTQAYQADLIKRTEANNMITALGYSQKESDILLDLAEIRKKAGGAAALRRLTLTDYEKAYKAGLISLDAVLERMRGEYAPADIDLEKKLLEAGKA